MGVIFIQFWCRYDAIKSLLSILIPIVRENWLIRVQTWADVVHNNLISMSVTTEVSGFCILISSEQQLGTRLIRASLQPSINRSYMHHRQKYFRKWWKLYFSQNFKNNSIWISMTTSLNKCASQYIVLVWLCCLGVLCLKCPY